MSLTTTRVSFSNILTNIIVYGTTITTINNMLPSNKLVTKYDKRFIGTWFINRTINRETNIKLVAQKNARKNVMQN